MNATNKDCTVTDQYSFSLFFLTSVLSSFPSCDTKDAGKKFPPKFGKHLQNKQRVKIKKNRAKILSPKRGVK
jgi:hypothetical protein